MARMIALDVQDGPDDDVIADIAGARARRRAATTAEARIAARREIRPAVMAAINRQQSLLYLALILGQDLFGWDGLQIRDVLACDGMAEMSGMPEFICGGILWDGEAVPVVDLAARTNRRPTPITKCTRIVVVEMAQVANRQLLGVIMNPLPQVRGRLHGAGIDAVVERRAVAEGGGARNCRRPSGVPPCPERWSDGRGPATSV